MGISLAALLIAQVGALSVWFAASALLPAISAEFGVPVVALTGLSTAVQLGFVTGALTLAISGVSDRFDPRRVFAIAAFCAAGANSVLLWLPPDGFGVLISRFLVGAFLAGVYPVGLKMAMGLSQARRGLLSSLLVGCLTLGTASSYLAAALGTQDWRLGIIITR